ncbi:enoyl-CoA hydratase/isomerase family protein [Aquincola sp. S2]|uniref:Enoyl-CoA hydratase/isomerase family protein n=1 Tax=Pseudaquabacterium terrae TaxID=2732868 RepID=A0ABX2EJ92_9BURK|nr:enoyl-CoA hydratase-related protein [Aquabacterium terrae]NRF68717.1 enoyl-CoA hydratase/isomerase family protein [Aquabacterium terrae]
MSHIHTELHDGVQHIQLNRPQKKNALTVEMYAALADALRAAEADPAVRVILLRGLPEVFTSGNDGGDFLHQPVQSLDAPVFQFLRALMQAEKPLIAAVAGDAVGIGTTLLLHCDLVIAADNARFSLPFTKLGLCAEAASSLALPLIVGWRRAAELLLSGEPISAARACDWGLVNRVVPAPELQAHALAAAAQLVARPPEAVRACKSLLRRRLLPALEQALVDEAHEFHALLGRPAAQEALSAFVHKRAPRFAF